MLSFLGFNKPSVTHTIESTAHHMYPESASKVAQTATYITRRTDGSSTETHVQTITHNGYPIQNKLTIHKDASGQVIDQQHEKQEGDSVTLLPHEPTMQATDTQISSSNGISPIPVNSRHMGFNWSVPSPDDFQHSIQKYFFEVQKQQNALLFNILQLLKKLPAIDPEPFELVVTKAKIPALAIEPKAKVQVDVKENVQAEK